jgi:hypothetical protein
MHKRAGDAGSERRVLLVQPDDRVSEEMMPDVASLPHGWGRATSAP